MKKTLLLSLIVVSLLFSGCGFNNLAVPEKVDVKVDATYEFPILALDSSKSEKLNMSNMFDLEKLINGEESEEGGSSNSPFKVYKYDGGSKYQQYLLHMPIKTIDFDFASSFGEMDFSTAMQGFDINKEFSIPNVGNLDETQRVDLSSIEAALNNAVTFFGMFESDGEGHARDLSVVFESGAFNTVSYVTGKFIVDSNPSDLNAGGGNMSGSVTLLDKDDVEISTAQFVNNRAALDIANTTFTSTGMHLRYNGSDFGVTFVSTIAEDSEIAKADGITLDPSYYTAPTAHVVFPLALSDELERVYVNEGSLSIDIATPTDGSWSDNVITGYTVDITGGLECQVTNTNKTASLANQELKNEDIVADAEVAIALNNAKIDFTNPPTVSVNTQITNITATVKMGEDFETTISQVSDVPEEISSFVDKIYWSRVGFKVTGTNKLPEGNDIGLKIWSDFFGIPEGTTPKAIESGKEEEQVIEFYNEDDPAIEGYEIESDFTTATGMDVEGVISLPGDGNKLVVTNVVPGETYSVSLKVDPVFEWAEAIVKMPDSLSTDFSGEFNTNINKQSLFESLGKDIAVDKIKIESMPIYLFASLPSLSIFEETEFKGTIKAFYGKETTGTDGSSSIQQITPPEKSVYVVGSYDEVNDVDKKEVINFVEMPELTKNEKGEIDNSDNKFSESTIDFAEALNLKNDENDKDATLCIKYDFGMSGGTGEGIPVSAEDLETLKRDGKSSISMDLVLILTLDFAIEDEEGTAEDEKGIVIDLMNLINSSDEEEGNSSSEGTQTKKDILNRTEPTDISDFEKYLEAVDHVEICLEDMKFPISGKVDLTVKMFDDSEPIVCSFGGDEPAVIPIPPEKLLKQFPLTPEVKLQVKDDLGLLRESDIAGKLKLKVIANGKIPVYPFEEKKSQNSEQNNGGSN